MTNYTVHSYQDYTAADGDTTFNFTKEILQTSHIAVYQKTLNGNWTEITDFTATGSSGSVVVTMGGSVSLAGNDTVRIARETPRPGTQRIVDFADGDGLTATDLDTSVLQNLYIAQEAMDAIFTKSLNKREEQYGGNDHFDAGGSRIQNVGAPRVATDAARYGDITSLSVSSGNLPAVTEAQDASFLVVKDIDGNGAQWTIRSNGEAGADLGLGLAAYRDIGTGLASVIPLLSDADARYLQVSSNLSGVNTGVAQSNLGLGSAAVATLGTSAYNVVQLDANARLPAVDARNLDLTNNTAYRGRCDAGAVIGFITGSNTIPHTGEIRLRIANIQSSYLNASDIQINTTNQWITVNPAGGMRARLSLSVANTGRTLPGDYAFQVKLNTGASTVPVSIWTSRPYYVPTGGIQGAGPVTLNYECCLTNPASTVYEFKIGESGVASTTSPLVVLTGYVAVEALT